MRPVKGLIIFFTVIVLSLLIIVVKLVYFSPPEEDASKQVAQEGIFDSLKTFGSDFGDIVDDTKQGTAALREFIASVTNTNTALQFSDQELDALRQKLKEKQGQEISAQAQLTNISNALSESWEVTRTQLEDVGPLDAKFFLQFDNKDCTKNLAFYELARKDEIQKHVLEINTERLEQQCKLEIFSENEEYITVDVCSNDTRCEDVEELKNIL